MFITFRHKGHSLKSISVFKSSEDDSLVGLCDEFDTSVLGLLSVDRDDDCDMNDHMV